MQRSHLVRPWARWGLALASAIALPASYAGLGLWFVTWIAFVPLLIAIDGLSPRRAAWVGFGCGLPANILGYHWLIGTIHRFGGFPLGVAWLFLVLLCAYQALVFVLFSWAVVRLQRAGVSVLLSAPVVMVAIETWFPLLFPISMGATQYPVPIVIQAAELFGSGLLTAVVLAVNGSVFAVVRRVRLGQRILGVEAVAGPAALALVLTYGGLRMPLVERSMGKAESLRVGVVQVNMDMHEKWLNPAEGVHRYDVASRQLEQQGAELIVWPEAAFASRAIGAGERSLRGAVSHGLATPLLFGALTHFAEDGRTRLRNSAIMLDPAGRVTGMYHKTHLLPFGEYLPGGELFPRLYDLAPHRGLLRPGSSAETLRITHHGKTFRVAPLICYEDILPSYVRSMLKHGRANLLVNMTNDAWFGDTAAPRIHLGLSVLRAVEHRRFLIRATNSGISACIDPRGRIAASIGVGEQGTFIQQVALMSSSTPFLMLGNVLGYLATVLLVLALWRSRAKGKEAA